MNLLQINNESSSASRFSLILLEPDEIYFEDYLVYYNSLQCPFNSDANPIQVKGNLKICSKSFVFDPLNLSQPIIKFPFKSIDKIVKFDEVKSGNDADDYALRKKCFAVSAKQIVQCKANNKIGPYTIVKRENQADMHYFQFIFTNVNDSLDLLCQLHRASTLEYEQEDIMLQIILKSRLSRNAAGSFDLHQLDDMFKEQIQFQSIVNKINPLVANPGRIILTNMCLYYKPFNNLDNEQKLFKIKLKHIKYVIKRRYHLKKIGIEIVFSNELANSISFDTSSSVDSSENGSDSNRKSLPYLYLTFDDETTRDLFYTRLVVDQRDKLTHLDEFNPENMLQSWRYGSISNFDYLMYLNNMADRSYNDLTQYPVFPWVLTDYTSQSLDLNDPKIYRDLSKPIGALNEERLQRLKQRCKEMQAAPTGFSSANDSTSPHQQQMFLYGSHYSTPAFVLYYLVRQYPEWQLCLQNGRFDHPNRLFHSIADTWRNCLSIDSDVKELIPEFYDTSGPAKTRGQFLRNDLELDLGIRQDTVRVNNVILPLWANNSTNEFINKMRDALESQYVSDNLHKWIDLIFGYKQQGEEALKADNLFYYLCYEGAVDLDSIKSYSERKSLEIQIQEFGQIPTQLFNTPHLPRQISKSGDLLLNELKLLPLLHKESESNDKSNESETRLKENTTKHQMSTNKKNFKKSLSVVEQLQSQYKIQPSNFKQLTCKLDVKLHKGQINDCIFIEAPYLNKQASKDANDFLLKQQSVNSDQDVIELPLVCSVSNDYWLKIYSLEDRSLFRSHNVANFSLSSVECLQTKKSSSNDQISDQEASNRILLHLSCWDNSIYMYDMNYNRCIHTATNLHDDAISRVRLMNIIHKTLVFTSSWDSMIKVWQNKNGNANLMNVNDGMKMEYISELCHDSSVIDFQLSRSYLASICDDGSLYLWRMNRKKLQLISNNLESSDLEDNDDDADDQDDEGNQHSLFSFMYIIPSSSDIGSITDCKILEPSRDEINEDDETSSDMDDKSKRNITTLAICTSNGYIKIYNIDAEFELFSLKLANNLNVKSKLNKLYYSLDFIITIDSTGHVYFIDLQKQVDNLISQSNGTSLTMQKQQQQQANSSSSSGSYLSHTIKLSESCLQSLCLYKEMIVCVGDAEGNLYFLSLIDF